MVADQRGWSITQGRNIVAIRHIIIVIIMQGLDRTGVTIRAVTTTNVTTMDTRSIHCQNTPRIDRLGMQVFVLRGIECCL